MRSLQAIFMDNNRLIRRVLEARSDNMKPQRSKTKGAAAVVLKRLVRCARCGHNHGRISFHRLTYPCGALTHWTRCPRSGQPILLRIVASPNTKLSDAGGH